MSNLEIAPPIADTPRRPLRCPSQTLDDALFDSVYENFPQPIWLVDPATLALLRVNQAMCAELGIGRADLMASTEADLCGPGEAPRLVGIYTGAALEAEALAKSGRWTTYVRQQRYADSTFGRVQLQFSEVTYNGWPARMVIAPSLRQRRKDSDTRQQIEILKSLVDNAEYGLGRYCLARKRLVYFNQHMMGLIGCLDEVAPGLPALGKQNCDYIEDCFAHPADWQEFLNAAQARQIFQKIILWRSQSGALRYMRMHGVPTESADGVQMDLSVEDATEAVRHEQQFRQSQKMEALGRMAGGVAHDFNNLLLVILGHAELLDEALPKDSDMRRHTTKLITASRQAADITGTLVTFSRGEEPLIGLLPLNKAIREYAHLLPSFLRAGVMLDMDLAGGEFHILANSTHVEQVVLNLCVNARDAMPDGGRVIVRTRHVPGEGDDKGSVMLEVSDNGVGMDAETRAHIFEPFYTTKARGKGTGLGLALVYGIVTQYGGRIEVDTEPGRGTSFRIFFPLGERARDEVSAAGMVSRPETVSHRKTVLLVDDQPEIRNMVGDFLQTLGHEVICAEDGRAALEKAIAHDGNIDLLLSDVMMPHMDGFELATRIREERPEIAVLLMSGYTGPALAKRGKQLGDVPFLAKPFSMRQLQTSVETLLDGSECQLPAAVRELPIAAPEIRPEMI